MSTLLIIAGVILLLGLVAMLTIAIRAEGRRQRILAEQAQTEARIQLRTQAALSDMYDTARRMANERQQ
ncbi:MAG: hypothetical protein KDE55_25125 [Novosphingobium sp.]|nr:hypothetical protein [Novosphingobium sp.]